MNARRGKIYILYGVAVSPVTIASISPAFKNKNKNQPLIERYAIIPVILGTRVRTYATSLDLLELVMFDIRRKDYFA
jgi:hypothetical protein